MQDHDGIRHDRIQETGFGSIVDTSKLSEQETRHLVFATTIQQIRGRICPKCQQVFKTEGDCLTSITGLDAMGGRTPVHVDCYYNPAHLEVHPLTLPGYVLKRLEELNDPRARYFRAAE